MKKTILKHLNVSGYENGIDLTECKLSVKKLEEAKVAAKSAKKNVAKAKQELDLALEISIKQIKANKKLEEKTGSNDNNMAGLKSGITKEKKELKAKYRKMVKKLERKKNNMKKKLDKYKGKGQNKWDSFKLELRHDLGGIEKTVKDFKIGSEKSINKFAS